LLLHERMKDVVLRVRGYLFWRAGLDHVTQVTSVVVRELPLFFWRLVHKGRHGFCGVTFPGSVSNQATRRILVGLENALNFDGILAFAPRLATYRSSEDRIVAPKFPCTRFKCLKLVEVTTRFSVRLFPVRIIFEVLVWRAEYFVCAMA